MRRSDLYLPTLCKGRRRGGEHSEDYHQCQRDDQMVQIAAKHTRAKRTTEQIRVKLSDQASAFAQG
jgi:hypothetical protein